MSDLVSELRKREKQARTLRRTLGRKSKGLQLGLQKFNSETGNRLIELLQKLSTCANDLVQHYSFLRTRAEDVSERLSSQQEEGPLSKAYSLYKEAFGSIEGIRAIGRIKLHVFEEMPIYELSVAVAPELLKDRARLRKIERQVDDIVESRDPSAVGAFALRYEPAAGAA
jgi:hypothetical protein